MKAWTAISHNSKTGETKLQSFVGPHDSAPAKKLYETRHLQRGSNLIALISGEMETRGIAFNTKVTDIDTGGVDFPSGF